MEGYHCNNWKKLFKCWFADVGFIYLIVVGIVSMGFLLLGFLQMLSPVFWLSSVF